MMTRDQMLKMGGRRIAKRPPGNGKGVGAQTRAATTGKPSQAAAPNASSRHTTAARGNSSGPKPTSYSGVLGANKQQQPAMSNTGPRSGFKGPKGGGSGF